MGKHSRVPPDATLRAEVLQVEDFAGELQADATVTIEALYRRGTSVNVPEVTLPIALNPVPGEPGDYVVVIDADNGLAAGQWYTADVRLILAGGAVRVYREDIYVTQGREP